MKVCILGAGAVGGHIAARLAAASDAEVSVVARGEHLEAIRKNGITLKSGGEDIHDGGCERDDDAPRKGANRLWSEDRPAADEADDRRDDESRTPPTRPD